VQTLIVSVIVGAAFMATAWQLMPQFMRRGVVRRLALVAPSQRGLLERLAANAENSACGSCKGCTYTTARPAVQQQVTLNNIPSARRTVDPDKL
jgi:hypothetical protein